MYCFIIVTINRLLYFIFVTINRLCNCGDFFVLFLDNVVLSGVYSCLSISQPLPPGGGGGGGGGGGSGGGREEDEESDCSMLLSVASPIVYLLEVSIT